MIFLLHNKHWLIKKRVAINIASLPAGLLMIRVEEWEFCTKRWQEGRQNWAEKNVAFGATICLRSGCCKIARTSYWPHYTAVTNTVGLELTMKHASIKVCQLHSNVTPITITNSICFHPPFSIHCALRPDRTQPCWDPQQPPRSFAPEWQRRGPIAGRGAQRVGQWEVLVSLLPRLTG